MNQDGNSRMARNTLVLYFRMAFQMAVCLYTSRVVLRMLGVQDYGIYDVVAGIVVMLSFLNNSLTTCTLRFITVALGKGEHAYLNDVYSVSISIHVLMALFVLLLGETVGLWYVLTQLVFPPEMLWPVVVCYQCSLAMGMLMIVSMPYNATIIAYERMTAFAGITVMDAMLKLGVASALCLFAEGRRLVPYALLMLCAAVITRVSYSVYCRRAFPQLRFHFCRDRGIVREMLSFAGWSTFGNASIACNTQGLNLVLNSVGGPAVNAARGVAFQVQMAVTQFVASFQMAINPQITKTYASGQLEETHKLIYKSVRLTFCMLLILCLPLIVEAPAILGLWLVEVPEGTATFLRLLLVILMFQQSSNALVTAIAATGKIKRYEISLGVLMLTIVPISYLVLRLGGAPWSVFVVFLAVVIVAFFVFYFINHRIMWRIDGLI